MARFGDRTFGVEIECGHPGGMAYVATKLVYDDIVEFEHNRWDYDYDDECWYDENGDVSFTRPAPYGWTIGCDGSGVELRTPVMRGNTDMRKLRKVMQYLNRIGTEVSQYDGMHVHFGAEDFDSWQDLHKLVVSWSRNVRLVEQVVAPSRRGARSPWRREWLRKLEMFADAERRGTHRCYTYVNEWTVRNNQYVAVKRRREQVVDSPGRMVNEHFGRYDLNVAAVANGTIEFRLHEGTINPDRAEAWIRFCDAFLNAVRDRVKPMPRYRTRAKLFNAIKLDRRSARILGAKVAEGDWEDLPMSEYLRSNSERYACEDAIVEMRDNLYHDGNMYKLQALDAHIGW